MIRNEDSTIKEEKLSVAHLSNGLKKRTLKNVGTTLFAQIIKVILQLLSIVLLARLLEPEDFGLVAIAAVFSGVATVIMNGGLLMATVQREHVTHNQVSNLFWINTFLGLALFVCAVLFSPLLALLYSDSRLALIMASIGVVFLIGGMSVQHEAVLQRQMEFKKIAFIDVVSMASGIFGAIIMAWLGFTYWSLVALPIITESIKTALRWSISGWKPSIFKTGSGTRGMVRFGAHLASADSIGYFVNNATPLFVGYIGGAQSLGYFNRSSQIASIPTNVLLPPVTNVLKSALSRIATDELKYSNTVIALLRKISFVCMFVSAAMLVTSDMIVLILLGDSWVGATPIFVVLALFTMNTPITTIVAIALIVKGHVKALFHWRIFTLVILLLSLLIGSLWGVMGVVWAFGLSAVFVRVPLFLIYSCRFLPIKMADFAITLLPVVSVSVTTILIVNYLRSLWDPANVFIGFCVFVVSTFFVYVSVALVFKQLRRDMLDSVTMLKKMFFKQS